MKFAGKLGMTEMEIAAERIMSLHLGICTHDDFTTETQKKGFSELLYNGWLRRHKYNGVFKPSQELLQVLGVVDDLR